MSDDPAFERIRANLRQWDEDAVELGLREFQRRRETHTHLDGSIERVRASLRRWSSDEVETGLAEFRFRRDEDRSAQRKLGLGLGALGAAAAIALVAAALLTGRDPAPVAAGQGAASAGVRRGAPAAASVTGGDRRVPLEEGSELLLVGRESEAQVVESTVHRVVVAMNAGRATFRVRHRPERVFIVRVGGVQLEDLGTVFDVTRGAEEVSVNVVEGVVQVTWASGVERLEAGNRRTYPLASDASKRLEVKQPSPAASAVSSAPGGGARAGGLGDGQAWRAAAREGRFGPAFQLLQAEGLGNVRDEPNDLLLAADVARLSGHAGDAVEPLRRLLRNHRGDPRSPAAAFTLGSVLLRDLGRPREAVAAFLEVQRLAPAGNLAEDAEARGAEAWFRAGEHERAEAARLRYGARYPQGRHLAFLKNLIQNKR